MKEKRKKIVARVGAMVAAVLLFALCALPCFAEGRAVSINEYFTQVNGINESTPLYYLMNRTNFDWATEQNVYQISFDAEKNVGVTDFITYEGVPTTTGTTVIRNGATGQYVTYWGTYWVTSHTTRNGIKYVYLDLMQEQGETPHKVMRIRFYIDSTGNMSSVQADESDFYEGDATILTIATSCNADGVVPLDYVIARNFVASWDVKQGNYQEFYNAFNGGCDIGYENGATQSQQLAYNKGYNDGMSQSSLIDGVTAIFRAPMEFVDGALDFNIMGINLAGAVHVIITMAIIAVVVTIIWKAVK